MSPTLPVLLASGEPSSTSSIYMPMPRVEIAFTATYATPAASRVWTDVTDYVELHDKIDITVGRQDERSTADANDLTLTLDNTDGRFTALRAASPYYPNVKIGRPIRVSVTTVTGVAFIRFVGFIDQWPVEWDGTDAYAKATIRATSRLSRLGLTAQLRSTIEPVILASDPTRYWTLGDASGSTQSPDSSGANGGALARAGTGTAPTFGTDSGAEGPTVTFAGGQYLSAALPGNALALGLHLALRINALPATNIALAQFMTATGIDGQLILNNTGLLRAQGPGLATPILTGPTLAADGACHDILWIFSTGGADLYVDGSLADSDTYGPTTFSNATRLDVGSGLPGVLSHVAYYAAPTGPSGADITAMSDAVLTGFAGERTDERLLRLLDMVDVSASEIDTETGVETMTYQLTAGMAVVDALRECESTEGGVLFDGADGDVKFHNRSHRYLTSPAATLDMASQHVGSDYAPRLDRSTLINDVTVDNPSAGRTARATNAASITEYGIATGSASSIAESQTALQEKADWLLASYAEPHIRVPSLTVDVLAHVGLTPSAETLLGVTVGSLLAVTNVPTQSDTTSPTYFVEGYSESIGPESYEITFNLSPTYPTLNTFVLDDATRGVLDTSILAY